MFSSSDKILKNTLNYGGNFRLKRRGHRRLPGGVWPGLHASLSVSLPHAVGHLVTDSRHHFDEFQRPIIQVERADPGQVCTQVPVNARALDANQSSEVETCPVWV